MQDSFIKYLVENKKLSLQTVQMMQAQFPDADYETENKINEIIELLIECELDPNIYLSQYPGVIELANIEDKQQFNDMLEYIREYVKKNKKKVNPYLLIHLLLASQQILENNKKEQTDDIIALLQSEGLMVIFEPKVNKSRAKVEQILYTDYKIVSRNINILKQERKYKELVYVDPLILINPNEKEVEKLLKEFQEKNNKDKDKEKDKNKEKEKEQDREQNEEAEGKKKEKKDEEDAEEKVKVSGHEASVQEKRLLKLGNEEKVLPVLESFNKYTVPYEVLNNNPNILRRNKIHNIPEIMDILYKEGIPFRVIYDCPEILEKGKADEIEDIIRQLKIRGISLTIIVDCPEILIDSTPERIRDVVIDMEKNNVDTFLIYSTPEILISGNKDKYIQLLKDLDNDVLDTVEEIIGLLPEQYISFEEISNKAEQMDIEMYNGAIKTNVGYSDNISVIKNINNAKSVLNTLESQGIDTEIVTKQPAILLQQNQEVEELTRSIKNEKLGFGILLLDPNIAIKSNPGKIQDVVGKIKEIRPNSIKKIIKKCPSLLYEGNADNIEKVIHSLEKANFDIEVVDTTPQILLRDKPEEITKVIAKLYDRGYTKEQIKNFPEILVKGEEKYIDRNIETFKRNNIKIPLHLVYCISARNNEKNIDTLIEHNLEQYIEKTPEILELKNSRLIQRLEIAKENDINILKSVKNKEVNEKEIVFNIEYFKSTDEQISKKYDLDIKYIQELGAKAEKEEGKLRRIKNDKLYNAVYPILEKQAKTELKEYEQDKISYTNNSQRISKQKVIREAYLELENKTEHDGKDALKEIDTKKMLTKKLDKLTKGNVTKLREEKQGGRCEKF